MDEQNKIAETLSFSLKHLKDLSGNLSFSIRLSSEGVSANHELFSGRFQQKCNMVYGIKTQYWALWVNNYIKSIKKLLCIILQLLTELTKKGIQRQVTVSYISLL